MASSRVPPYLIAGGRTRPSRSLEIETLVEQRLQKGSGERVRFESARILALAAQPISVAEVSALLGLPLGTTLVLVSDLLDSGDLRAHDTRQASGVSDLDIMTRIIHRVREL